MGGTEYDQAIGKRLRHLRKTRVGSGYQLSARCKEPLTASQISKLERGDQQFTARLLHILADALGAHVWELLPDPPVTAREELILAQLRDLAAEDFDTIHRVVDAFARPADGGTRPIEPETLPQARRSGRVKGGRG